MPTARQLRWRATCLLYGSPATRWLVPAVRRLSFGLADVADRVRGRERPWYVPPRRLNFVGGGPFLGVGRHFVDLLTETGELRSDSAVLDIGSGIGRMAVPLIEVLGPSGRYEGFDVVRSGIQWSQQQISSRHPNFRFRHADLRNDRYSPDGATSAENFTFPYPDNCFDVAFAASVFTHMLPDAIENYLREAHRVLRPGGRLLSSWYLLQLERAHNLGSAGSETSWFPVKEDDHRIVSSHSPEFAIAFNVADAVEWHRRAGFGGIEAEPGQWAGGGERSFQDLFRAEKERG